MILPFKPARTTSTHLLSSADDEDVDVQPSSRRVASSSVGLRDCPVTLTRGDQLQLLRFLRIDGPVQCDGRGTVSPTAMLSVLKAIDDHARLEGVAWPSLKTLQRMTKLSDSTVRRAIHGLKFLGFIDVRGSVTQRRSTGRTYHIQWESILSASTATVAARSATIATHSVTVASPSEASRNRTKNRLPLRPPIETDVPVAIAKEGAGDNFNSDSDEAAPRSDWDEIHSQMFGLGVQYPHTATQRARESGCSAKFVRSRIEWFNRHSCCWKGSRKGQVLWSGIANATCQTPSDRGWLTPDHPLATFTAKPSEASSTEEENSPPWEPPSELRGLCPRGIESLANHCQPAVHAQIRKQLSSGRDPRSSPMLSAALMAAFKLRAKHSDCEKSESAVGQPGSADSPSCAPDRTPD